ncbi:sodium-dependent transporter [Anaerococcus sp. AGMB00486]|uniref:Sodium-dependent transporter n=1 Tax=Anaerococcus faecalis TaxID=2742993 RepID=A0ABX2N8K4_9FIRM|nr:sodium-dependent transporter [Anaerococcus faecalis]NVF10990.1 sodium-dependent transporter [Anaerococcus faecalis]
MNNERKFSSRLGFILTAVGSAVGMANVWGFPYKFQDGGLIFLLFYLVFVSIFAYVGLSSEFAIGRRAETGTLGSYEYALNSKKNNEKHSFISRNIGFIPLIGSLFIAIGYAVIVTYVLKALVDSLSGELLVRNSKDWFESFSQKDYSVVFYHFIIIAVTLFTCLKGAHTIEKSNKIMMPAFFILFVIIAIYILSLPNALEGYKYMFRLDLDKLNLKTMVNAMGQAFFSLSVTGSGMIVCGSYLNRDEDIISATKSTAIFDTLAALLSSCVIVPSVLVFGLDQAGGPGLLFEVLPTVLQNIKGGRIFAIILYTAVIFAGVSSLQNMFEVIVESIMHRFKKISRIKALTIIGLITFIVGVNMETINEWGPWMDLVSIYIIPIGASIGAITWFYFWKKEELLDEVNQGADKKVSLKWYRLGRYVYVPIAIILSILALVFKVTF